MKIGISEARWEAIKFTMCLELGRNIIDEGWTQGRIFYRAWEVFLSSYSQEKYCDLCYLRVE